MLFRSAQEDGLAWAIFDHAAIADVGLDQATLDKALQAGQVVHRNSLEELATQVGINPQGLVNTVVRWNNDVALGEDRAFFKPVLNPIATAPYYAVQVIRQMHVVSSGGVKINTDGQVLKPTGEVIPGLYAAGETTGGIYSRTYPGSGSAVSDALIFGRIAGRHAAEL